MKIKKEIETINGAWCSKTYSAAQENGETQVRLQVPARHSHSLKVEYDKDTDTYRYVITYWKA